MIEEKTSHCYYYFTDTRKSPLRSKVNSMYNEKLFTSNCYKFMNEMIKNNFHNYFKVKSLH